MKSHDILDLLEELVSRKQNSASSRIRYRLIVTTRETPNVPYYACSKDKETGELLGFTTVATDYAPLPIFLFEGINWNAIMTANPGCTILLQPVESTLPLTIVDN